VTQRKLTSPPAVGMDVLNQTTPLTSTMQRRLGGAAVSDAGPLDSAPEVVGGQGEGEDLRWAQEMPPAFEAEVEEADSWAALREVGVTDELLAEMRDFFAPYQFGLELLLEALPALGVHVV